jgi:hypothetical protein
MIPQSLAPMVFTFSGSGNVSQVRVGVAKGCSLEVWPRGVV